MFKSCPAPPSASLHSRAQSAVYLTCSACLPPLTSRADTQPHHRARLPRVNAPRFLNANASAFCSVKSPTPKKETFLLGILGTFSGCIGPLVGVGGGIISIPIWREFTTLPQKMLSATSHCGSVDIYYWGLVDIFATSCADGCARRSSCCANSAARAAAQASCSPCTWNQRRRRDAGGSGMTKQKQKQKQNKTKTK